MPRRSPTSALDFSVDANPKELSVNKHYKYNCSTVPTAVKAEQKKVEDAARSEAERRGWSVPPGPLGVELHFTFNDRMGDGDNPIKRTIDAIQHGLAFNDSRIAEGHWFRHVGIPSIRAKVYPTIDPDGDPTNYKATPTFEMPPGSPGAGKVIGA